MELTKTSGSLGHLSYCSNIHPGESWDEVKQNLESHIPAIKMALSPDAPFGIGLRLSAAAVEELSDTRKLAQFKLFLEQNNCYVFTINGFPYGPFHGTRVKEDVYLPDWKNSERVRYTNQLADTFATILPAGLTGSISTVPGAFKSSVKNESDIQLMAKHLIDHVAHLVKLEASSNQTIVLALEPEPCCFLETIDESVEFFTQYLFSDSAAAQLSVDVEADMDSCKALLRKHLTLCLDLCHAAVEFEDCTSCLMKLNAAGISVGKLQISSGLRIPAINQDNQDILDPYIDKVYLHQVIESHNDVINRYTDLPNALATLNEEQREWRVHFHVPIFLEELGPFSSTQFFIREALAHHKSDPISDHLEVETYTWDVLPESLRTSNVDKAIVRELQWVKDLLS